MASFCKRCSILVLLLMLGREELAVADGEADFWKWFTAHTQELAKIQRGNEPITIPLVRELHKIAPELTFEVGVSTNPREFIVSADGILSAFPAVKRLVAAAPAIPGWKIIAFRPRMSPVPEIQVGGGKPLKTAELRFRLMRTPQPGKRLEIDIFVTGRAVEDQTKQGVYLLLDSLLGEYDVETRIGGIEILDGSQAPKDARPFEELVTIVDTNR